MPQSQCGARGLSHPYAQRARYAIGHAWRRGLSPLRVAGELWCTVFGLGAGPRPARLILRNPAGDKAKLQSLRGHILVLNPWASWCVLCRAEMPLIVQAYRRFAPQGVRFIGIGFDTAAARNKIPELLQHYGITYPIWTGADYSTLQRLQAGDMVPDPLILGPHGVIRFRLRGQMRPGELAARLQWMLHPAGIMPPVRVIHRGKSGKK